MQLKLKLPLKRSKITSRTLDIRSESPYNESMIRKGQKVSNKTSLGLLRDVISTLADTVGRNNKGEYILRKGFYYRLGGDSKSFAKEISRRLKDAGIKHTIINRGEKLKTFKGGEDGWNTRDPGASVMKGSHWWVTISLD